MRSLNRKAELLTTKLNALKSELQTSKEIVSDANSEIQRLYNERISPPTEDPGQKKQDADNLADLEKHNPTSDESHKVNENTDTAEKLASPEVKKMFKKVASICHPDKLALMENSPNKTWLENLYQKARKALEDNDFFDLLCIWQDLGLQAPKVTKEQILQIENKINAIKKEILAIESSIAWHWFFAKTDETKQKILEKIFELLDEKNKRNTGS